MKALTIHPFFAELMTLGKKTIECRTWKTDYRGDILITSSAKKYKDTIPGHALLIAELYDVRRMHREDADAACMQRVDCSPDKFAWCLRNLRLIEPFAVKGKLSLWNFDDESKIKVIMSVDEFANLPEDKYGELCDRYWEDLYV